VVETADPFVNALNKKIRNKKKKLDKIKQLEQRVKEGKSSELKEEQKAMMGKKDQIHKELKDIDKTMLMYKQAFPDNPVFAQGAKKKAAPAGKKQVEQGKTQEEQPVDVSKVIEDALRVIADAVIINRLQDRFGESIPGASQNIQESLQFLYRTFESLTGAGAEDYIWRNVRDQFVDNFTRLAVKS